MDSSNIGNVLGNMEVSSDELWTQLNLSPIDQTNPIQDFSWQQGKTDLGPLQDCNLLLAPHVETNRGHQLNQAAEPSPEPSRRGRRPKLSDFQRRENKRNSDKKHRQKQKDNFANLIKEKQNMEKQAGEMKSENEHLKNYIQHLEKEIKEQKSQRDELITDVQGQSENVSKMIMEWLEFQSWNANVPAAAAKFFRKLEEDEESNVDFEDFVGLDEKQECRTVGKYQIPLSLVPTAERITEVHGDVCATSTINRTFAGKIYILFCATVKEMSELPLEKVTEETMLKWRDAIKDALCVKFKVEFAMEHLKKTIAPRYFGLKANEEVEKIDVDISKVEGYLNGLKECKKFIGIAKEFDDKPLSEGLWG